MMECKTDKVIGVGNTDMCLIDILGAKNSPFPSVSFPILPSQSMTLQLPPSDGFLTPQGNEPETVQIFLPEN